MQLLSHHQLALLESPFSRSERLCSDLCFRSKPFYLLTERAAALCSRVILSQPNLRNCCFSYVFITLMSLWVITRHKLGQKLLPSSFFVLKTKRRDFYICLGTKVPRIKRHVYVKESTRLTDLIELCDCRKLECSRSIDKSSHIIFIYLSNHSLL